ncbi:MAG TPA: apolipoprotein N-acyltransferase [Rhizomicrobium sp.]|nr:apolipoprotein N-acyltransferase [Rhizomicrobium sp.]
MNFVTVPAERLRRLSGWRRAAAAFVLGAASATAFPPFYFFPALLLGLAGLALLLDGVAGPRAWRAAARIGWCFFFGQFLIGLHWIVYPLLIEPERFAWLVPFAITLMPGGLALFGALATGLTVLLLRRPGTARLIALAAAIAATEWLRGHILTGFPWNLPAYGWGASEAVMQSGAVIGAYGLSLLTLLLGVSLADLARRNYRLPVTMALVFVGLWGFGAVRLQQPNNYVPNVSLRLVQPNIPQTEMYGAYRARNWQLLMALSRRSGTPTHIIWPESAVVFPLARSPEALAQIAQLTGNGTTLMTGSARGDEQGRVFNTMYLLGPGAAPLGVYDKYHPVPFGEYLPLAPLLSRLGIAKLTAGEIGFSAGPGPQSYELPGAPAVTPLICYEAIFPGAVTPASRPGWFVNITNDAWFGPWAGPRQHLLIARMRAIEEGLPIARVAITGISAVIDGRGRIVTSLGLNQSGVIDAGLPVALAPTPYARFGDLGFAIILLACATISGVLSPRRQTL